MSVTSEIKNTLVGVAACLLAVGGGVLVARLACAPSLPKLQQQASALDTALGRDTAQVRRDTLATDSVINPLTPGVKTAIHTERKGWHQALKTSQAQTANQKKQVRALTPRLQLFVGAAYEARPDQPLLQGLLDAEVGAIVTVGRTRDLELYARQQLLDLGPGKPVPQRSLNLRLRQRFRLF